MMGGDDLDDDQWNQPVRGSDDDDEGSDAGGAENGKHEIKTNKRKSELSKSTMTADDDREEAQQTKTKKQKSPAQLLLQAGRNIEQQDSIQQAAFLTTAVQHYSLLESQLENEGGDKAVAQMTKPNLEIMPHHCLGQADTTNCNTLIERIREAVAVKKMKQWKNVGSPCVVIVCISARRAVALLKELAPLKVRTAKLFPKNGSVEEQRQQLASCSFGLAVGTPHRMRQLAENDNGGKGGGGGGKLSLEHTKLVIFDCHVSHKQFTVCTLPDTAPHCMALVRDCLLPCLLKRKDCKVAFM